MSKVQVIDNEITMVDRKAEWDKWDADDTTTKHDIIGLKLVGDSGFYDIVTSFDVEIGEKYILLYIIYDTGDSFHEERGRIEFIDLFTKDQVDIVKENERRIRENEAEWGLSLNLIHHTGEEYTISAVWKGFFEHLDCIKSKIVEVLKF